MHAHHARTKFPLLLLLLLPALILSTGDRAMGAGLRLIYSNDNMGEMDGCG